MYIKTHKNSAFKKKQNENIVQSASKLNSLLGLGSSFYLSKAQQVQESKINKQDIMSSAMFWDSKQRIDRVKSLILPNRNLKQFEDGEDFSLQQLKSIELLSLAKNQIIHLQPLSILETLVCLNINSNKVYDLSPIQSLSNLEQLYANNNLISDIQFFGKGIHIKLSRVELYNNKISSLRDTLKAVEGLIGLKQLDIQQNPVWNEQTKKYLMQSHISRLNGQLLNQSTKQKMIANSSMMSMSSSGFYKTTQSIGSISINPMNNKAQLLQKYDKLEMKYLELDDQFQDQIGKNVRLKGQLQKLLNQKQQRNKLKLQSNEKNQKIKLLKRKVKEMKENLFGSQQQNSKKAQLLRKLFQLQTISIKKNPQTIQRKIEQENFDQYFKNPRVFHVDKSITIKTKQQKQDQELLNSIEDPELRMLLQSNDNSLSQLRKQLAYLTDD